MADLRRIDIGFQGGQVLSVRSPAEAHDGLTGALESDASGGWHRLATDDSEIFVDLRQVVYVRRESDAQKVGF